MLNLFCHFLAKGGRLPLTVLWLVCLGFFSAPALTRGCNTSPVFAFSQALYFEQYAEAQQWLPEIERSRGPQLARFLQQVLLFKRGYEEKDGAAQKRALLEIDDLIDSLADDPAIATGNRNPFSAANIMIHSARMQLAVGNLLRATTLAKEGKRLLDEILERSPGHADALLANGLYLYYTGSDDDSLGWMMRLLSLEGDRERGRKMIEKAVQHSSDHAFEAARSLMSDVAWNRQDTCRYVTLFEGQAASSSPSIAHHQQQISAHLFCGRVHYALDRLIELNSLFSNAAIGLSEDQQAWFFEAQLQAISALGDVDQLMNILAPLKVRSSRHWLVQFALAKALDTRGEHEQAVDIYRDVAASNIADRYRKLARIYLQFPYQAPDLFNLESADRLQFACGDGS